MNDLRNARLGRNKEAVERRKAQREVSDERVQLKSQRGAEERLEPPDGEQPKLPLSEFTEGNEGEREGAGTE